MMKNNFLRKVGMQRLLAEQAQGKLYKQRNIKVEYRRLSAFAGKGRFARLDVERFVAVENQCIRFFAIAACLVGG